MSLSAAESAVAALNAARAAAAAACLALEAALPETMAEADTIAPASAADSLAIDLKTRLAVRGWVNPRLLIDADDEPVLAAQALNAAAVDVETLFELRPGEWYMAVPARKRVLSRRGPAVIREELAVVRCTGDADDPTRRAFRHELGLDPLPPLAELPEPVLRALGAVRDWLAPEGEEPVGRAEILAELAARERAADLARMTAVPLIGAGHRDALAQLVADLARPAEAKPPLAARYVFGAGGAGKSTMLAHLQTTLAARADAPVVVRLDFDDRRLNPLDAASLELAFFDQLGVALPGIARSSEATLAALRGVRRRQRDDQGARAAVRRPAGKRGARARLLTAEGAYERERSERDSLLYGILADVPALNARAIVLLLDTAELIAAPGAAAVLEVATWLGSIVTSLRAPCVRVLVAGRDPPSRNPALDLLQVLLAHGHATLPAIALGELSADDAAALLAACGVSDRAVARAAAEALPGNPLLLTMAADALKAEPALSGEVRQAHAEGKVDPVSARRYLARRIVAHLADQRARPYVLTAMQLPEVTLTLLRKVVVPLVDGRPPVRPREAAKLFDALAASTWLTHRCEGRRALGFHPDIRSLALRLVTADEAGATLARRLHRRAIAFHEARRSAADRAFALYHRLALGEMPAAIPHRAAVARRLAPVLRDLPEAARDVLIEPGAAMPAKAQPTDAEWAAMLEGVGDKEGEGARLLQRGNAAAALALYRSRPTRPPGLAPTFVVQAIADSGEWEADEIDVPRALAALDVQQVNRPRTPAWRDFYWLTRLALVRDAGRLDAAHLTLLEKVLAERRGSPAIEPLAELAAIAEATTGRRIAPEAWSSAKANMGCLRLDLARFLTLGTPFTVDVAVSQLAVAQADWAARVHGDDRHRSGDAFWRAQAALGGLAGQPFAAVAQRLSDLGVHGRCTSSTPAHAILLLRGLTTEFARPLRETLAVRWQAKGGEAAVLPIVEIVLGAMSIRPLEFDVTVLPERLRADPEAWFGALVGYADRCRLLPLLCTTIVARCTAPEEARLARVARSFLAWDKALCGGGSSAW